MPKRITLIDLRNAIEGVKKQVMQEQGGEATNEQILTEVRTQNAKEIKYLEVELVNIALTRLLNDVINRKLTRAQIRDGTDLFNTYPGIPKSITLVKGRKKDIMKLTFPEFDLWSKAHDAVREDRNEKFKRLVEDCRQYQQSDEDTLEIAMKRKLTKERLALRP